MRLLLDTHTIIWYYEGSSQLGPAAKEIIDNPRSHLLISAVSLWELSIKIGLDKLRLDTPLSDMLTDYNRIGSEFLSVTPDHAIAVGALPWLHRDPFDRMLVAQAQQEDLTIITADRMIQQYQVPIIW